MANKRVLIFSLAYFPLVGGAEVAVKEITDRLARGATAEGLREGFEFDMITRRFEKLHQPFEAIGNIHVHRIDCPKNLFPFLAFLKARKLMKVKNYSHVWAIMANWAGFAALFFKMMYPEVKFVLTLQEGDPIGYIKRKVLLVYPLFKKIFTEADVVQAISNYLGEWAKEMGAKARVEVIPNGVDIKRFERLEARSYKQEAVFLITTSRLVEKNGIGDVIDAMKFLPLNVKFEIFGTGPLEDKLKKRAAKNKVEDRVLFLGLSKPEEVPMHLHAADIFIRPSLSEGMGNSFIEAMCWRYCGFPLRSRPLAAQASHRTLCGCSRSRRNCQTGQKAYQRYQTARNPHKQCQTPRPRALRLEFNSRADEKESI
jgi:glycosyltransferase involved in cell wall biosynthesis